jgi:hypothetical protein
MTEKNNEKLNQDIRGRESNSVHPEEVGVLIIRPRLSVTRKGKERKVYEAY